MVAGWGVDPFLLTDKELLHKRVGKDRFPPFCVGRSKCVPNSDHAHQNQAKCPNDVQIEPRF